MAKFEIIMPKMGESIIEATITKWLKKEGDRLEEDDAIVEIATDKVDSEIPSPVEGTLTKTLFEEGAVVPVGTVIAWVETESESEETDEAEPVTEVSAAISTDTEKNTPEKKTSLRKWEPVSMRPAPTTTPTANPASSNSSSAAPTTRPRRFHKSKPSSQPEKAKTVPSASASAATLRSMHR